ncbi:CPBP family intramembrane glutamic endopeptidase [Ruixingdingia sedimenti]|uniref:CPBP family intramembrane glutamic endopeptidase n=1 Tax=Ruixingdingia sedimenti TaxID=3073604 RepID=A0ABU1F2S7_9RHOB|nr:CPBP family intramembrane glutamic endopeptidase [Xinfangfangia sp. LG-4]MDR5651165.1 CPBP family intramembrane glutamic endopeptidase [Xinfangfangia sp. LG-4]
MGQGRLWLRVEFAALYLLAPVTMALVLPPRALFPMLFLLTGVGLVLLHRTPGFSWASLLRGRVRWGQLALFTLGTALLAWAVLRWMAPGQAFFLLHYQPELLAMIWALYPVLSALPQEIVFRPLFFRRYGVILPGGPAIMVLNAAVFSLAHLMYWNAVVALMTFAGGLVFAHAYHRQQSFPQAVLLHSLAGNVLFTVGLGIFFYSGNVARPF